MPRLSQIEKRFASRSGEELQAKIEELQAERRAFGREHRGPFVEDVNARLDAVIQEAQAALDAGLAQVAAGAVMLRPSPLAFGRSLSELASLDRIVHDEGFHRRMRAAIDASSPPVAKPKVDAHLAKLDSEITALETELRRREIELRRAAVDSELISLGGGKTAA
jgi:hypothetical protein